MESNSEEWRQENWDPKSWGELLKPGMEITDPKSALEYFDTCIKYGMRKHGHTREEAIRWMKENLVCFAGYYGSDVGERVHRLFNCTHPVFGDATPTAEEALQAGMKVAKSI